MATNLNDGLQSKLQEFFNIVLQEIYWCENHLVNVLATMTNVATDSRLKESFNEHREQTITHVQRLEKTFEQLNLPLQQKHCRGLQGIFDEGWQVIDETDQGSAQRDAALIIAAQKVEHYEIATYGSLITLAKTMGKNDIAQILVPTLNEEKQTDLQLTEIAETGINEQASQEDVESDSTAESGQLNGNGTPGTMTPIVSDEADLVRVQEP